MFNGYKDNHSQYDLWHLQTQSYYMCRMEQEMNFLRVRTATECGIAAAVPQNEERGPGKRAGQPGEDGQK